MDNTSDNCDTSIPEEIRASVIASTQFFKVSNPLEESEGTRCIRKHIMAVTSRGYLMELREGEVLRFTKLEKKDVRKILVHHEFQPLQLFIVFICHHNAAYAALYNNFKIMHQWPDIKDIISEDPDEVGAPSLRLTHMSGKTSIVTSLQLSSPSPCAKSEGRKIGETERGKQDAVSALAHRLKGGMRHVEFLNNQRKLKETIIVKKLATIQSQLGGQIMPEDDTLTTTITIDDDEEEEENFESHLPQVSTSNVSLELVNVRHKIIHDKWVIGINVHNKSERILVSDMQLMLYVSKGTHNIAYTTKILKVIQRRSSNNSTADQSDAKIKVSVENLDPPILRPKKRACILGVCEIPDFTEGSTVVCSGLVNYTCKTLSPENTQVLSPVKSESQLFQVAFEPVELEIQELHSHHVFIEKNYPQAGVPFKTVALIGGSTYNSGTLTSLVSPLVDLVKRISCEHEMVKVPGVSDMYCFYPDKYHPLSFSAVTFMVVNSHHVDLGLYTRDDNQAIILVHALLAALPPDVYMQPTMSHNRSQQRDSENTRQQLLVKMKEAAVYVMDGYETQAATFKKGRTQNTRRCGEGTSRDTKSLESKAGKGNLEFNRETYSSEREVFLARRQDVTFKANLYREWRKNLYKIVSEMDELYIRYLK